MKLSIVLSTHAAQFQAVAFKGDFAENVAKIARWGYDGVEIAIRDPGLVDADKLEQAVKASGGTHRQGASFHQQAFESALGQIK